MLRIAIKIMYFYVQATIKVAETNNVNLKNCPYDFTPVDVDGYEGGVYLVSCSCCGAKWETHASWVTRVSEPDWGIVKAFQEIQSLQSTLD